MVSLNPDPPETFHFFDPIINMEDPNKKIRKPYTITKSRESWTDQEHDKFLEALQLFDRDWKKIEAFVGSKTAIQIRSHAQKYFLKVQKNGTSEHLPPPRPKRKAAHPYPQKAPKNVPNVSQVTEPLQSSSAFTEPAYIYRPDSSSSVLRTPPICNVPLSSWNYNVVPPVNLPQVTKVMPDFAQVYSFVGSVFDPNESNHLLRLKQMDPVNVETALLLMRNLSINLTSPEFEDDRRLLSSHGADSEKEKSGSHCSKSLADKSDSDALSV